MTDNRRGTKDRRSNGRRFDERRKAGIGEIIPERRQGARRTDERRDGVDRRDSPQEWQKRKDKKEAKKKE